MLIYTMKWNKTSAVIIVLAVAAILVLLTIAIGSSSGSSKDARVGSADDVADFLEGLGWTVDEMSAVKKEVVIPQEFSEIYEEYNSLQKAQGYDLFNYSGEQVTIFTFSVTNYSSYSGKVVADVYVLDGKVIGGDVHSLELDGFMHGLRKNSK